VWRNIGPQGRKRAKGLWRASAAGAALLRV